MTTSEIDKWLEGATIEWHLSFEPDLDNQQDAIFYQGLGCIATVKYKEVSVDIYSDGDLRAVLKDDVRGDSTLRTTSDFLDFGLTSDEKIREANENNLLDWDMNNWFDLYVEGEHLDCVEHTLFDAIASASVYVRDESQNIKTLEDLTI